MTITVTTQAELNAAINAGDPDIIIDSSPNETALILRGNSSATLWGNSRAILRDSSSAILRDSSSADLRDNSSAILRDSSSAVLQGDSRAILWGDSSAVLQGNSSAILWGRSSATLWGRSSATLWGNSRAILQGNSSATLWGDSSAILGGDSSAILQGDSRADLRDNSRADLRDNSWADASGASSLRLHDRSSATAGPFVAIHRYSGLATVQGGVLIDLSAVQETDPTAWCEAHGVTVYDGVASLYKATDSDLTAGHGYHSTRYDVGSEPVAADFQADHGCGHGLHLSPTAQQATTYRPEAVRWVRVEVPVGEIVPIPSLLSGQVAKCKVRTCRVVAEVDVLGREVGGE